jgi:hypothetical protein
MKKLSICLALVLMAGISQAQFNKLKAMVNIGKKDTTESSSGEKKKGPGLMSKLVTKIAKTTGGAMVSTTADLDAVVPNVYQMTNLCPSEVGTADMAFYEGWKPGGNAVIIMFTTKNSFGLNKLDGDVTVNGKTAQYVSMGVYTAFGIDNTSEKTVKVTTSQGDNASFTLSPPKHSIKLKSINGLTQNIQLDLTKDITIEIENPAGTEGTKVLVKLVAKTVGIRAFYEVGYFPSTSTIKIPAAAFRNLNMSPGNKAFMNFKESFLMVERSYVDQAKQVSGNYPEISFANIYNDGKFVTVKTEPQLNTGITLEGDANVALGKAQYNVFKPNAFLSRSSDGIKTIGIKSFAVRGTTYVAKTTTENGTGADGTLEKTRTTLTAQFPQMSNEVWDDVLHNLHQQMIPVINKAFAATTLPVELVTKTAAYQSIAPYSKDDENTSVQFSRAYKTTKLLSAFMPISEGFGINNVDTRIFQESGTNALLTLTLDLQLSLDGNNTIMKPILGIELQGEANGFSAGTKYFTGTITGAPYTFKKKETITREVLNKIIQQDDLIKVLEKVLGDLKAKEKANVDYSTLWPRL